MFSIFFSVFHYDRFFIWLNRIATTLFLTLGYSPHVLSQAPKGFFPIDDHEPYKNLPTSQEAIKHPLEMGYLVMSLSERGEKADKQGDHLRAANYFRAISMAVPDRAIGYRKACAAYDLAGRWDKAFKMCYMALSRTGVTTFDFFKFVKIVLKKAGTLNEKETDAVNAVIRHLQQEIGDRRPEDVLVVECAFAARLKDEVRLSTCISHLGNLASSGPSD